jgi:hypothetical protein
MLRPQATAKPIQTLIDHAADVIEAIEYAIQLRHPDNDPFGTLDGTVCLQDCEFPWHIDDPLEIVRVVLGDERANQLEYEDYIEDILANVEFYRDKLLQRGNRGADKAPEGNSQGEESDYCKNS